jgi:hypothetical protein
MSFVQQSLKTVSTVEKTIRTVYALMGHVKRIVKRQSPLLEEGASRRTLEKDSDFRNVRG